MRDRKKFYRPKISKTLKPGDLLLKLKYGEIGGISQEEYKRIKRFFDYEQVIGESSSSVGKIQATSKVLEINTTFDIDTYIKVKDQYELTGIVGSKNTSSASTGDIICHNRTLNIDATFSYNDWVNLDDSWDTTGLFGIQTYDNDDELTEDRYVILSNGTTFIIKQSDYSYVQSNWEVADSITLGPTVTAVDLGLPSGLK